jgi:integrase
MAFLFRPTITTYRDPSGKRCKKIDSVITDESGEAVFRPGCSKHKSKSPCWYAQYKDAKNRKRRKKLSRNKETAKRALAKIEAEIEQRRYGLGNLYEEHENHPIEEHLGDYERFLLAKDDTKEHVRLAKRHVEYIVEECGFFKISDIRPGPVIEKLAEWRGQDISTATSNHYLRSIKGFTAWLERDGRTGYNPLKHLSLLNADVDRRHERRILPLEVLRLLLITSRTSKRSFRGLNGEARFVLYILAVYTGLRSSELASLTPASFDLASQAPTVTIEAKQAKNRRRETLPLHKELAGLVADYMNGMAPNAPLWRGTWYKQCSAKMVRADLEEARAAWIASAADEEERMNRQKSTTLCYRDSTGKVFDFHALRSQFISGLVQQGVHPKVTQMLARHSKMELTMKHYTHMGMADLQEAVELLPSPLRDKVGSLNVEAAGKGRESKHKVKCKESASNKKTRDFSDNYGDQQRTVDPVVAGSSPVALAKQK